MILGFLTTLSDEVLKTARAIGYTGLEVSASSWKRELEIGGQALTRAASDAKARVQDAGITITALADYDAVAILDVPACGQRHADSLALAEALGVKVVTSIFGKDPHADYAESIASYRQVMTPVAAIAEDLGIRIAFENWPGGVETPPYRGMTLATGPLVWEMMFDAVPSPAIGLEFDPSHLYWQQIDHIAAARRYADRIHHVHAKDTQIHSERLHQYGIFSGGCFQYRIPGYGEIDWHEFIATLIEIGFDGGIAIEHEDPYFAGDRFNLGLELGYKFLAPLIV